MKAKTFPLSAHIPLPKDVAKAVNYIANTDAKAIRKFWKQQAQHLKKLAKRTENIAFNPELKPIIGSLHIGLLKKLMKRLGMKGSRWIRDLTNGFPLIGTINEDGVYPQ